VKARRVKGLDPEGPLADQLERIVRVRLAELQAFMPEAADPRATERLHDMRIAAKRLRYILEVAEGSFGPYAAKAIKRVKELQDLIGEIHDADVHLPEVLAAEVRARAADVAAVRDRAGDDGDLDPDQVAGAPNAGAYRGLATLATYHQARREVLFERFLALWTKWERDAVPARLEHALGERPSHDGHGADAAVL
jgi:hypothetical protein